MFFKNIVEALLDVVPREDTSESRLWTTTYETLNEIVRFSTKDATTIVMQLVHVIMLNLNETLEMRKLSSDGKEKQNDLKALLCGCLKVIIRKLCAFESTKYGILKYVDQMINIFLRVFACRSATIHEEAILSIGSLAYAICVEFRKYMQEFY